MTKPHSNFWLTIALLLSSAHTTAAESSINWPAYGGAVGGGHYSSASQIDQVQRGPARTCLDPPFR